MNKTLKSNLICFNWSLLFTLILINLIPTIYTTIRIFFLGNIPSDWGFNIASQLAWINVMYEVIQEAMILPLFYLIGKSLKNKNEIENKLKSGLITSFLIYFTFSILLFIFTKNLLIMMAQKKEILEVTVLYIRIETIAIMISIFYKFISIFLISLNKIKNLFILLLCQMIMTIFSDIFLVSTFSISYKIGVNGVAIGNILVNTLLFFVAIILLKKDGFNIFSKRKISFTWQREWGKVGWLSGLESLVRNFAFIVMILKMINLVQQQGTFWIANNFIWGWLLLPVIALGSLIKRNTGEKHETSKTMLSTYIIITLGIILLWFLSMPGWKLFIAKVMNVSDYNSVYHVVIISVVFYIIFALNNVIDSIFYGLGRTDLMLIQSLIVNFSFFGTMFILFKMGVFQPTLDKITIMFGAGMTLDSIITFIIYFYLYKTDKLKAKN